MLQGVDNHHQVCIIYSGEIDPNSQFYPVNNVFIKISPHPQTRIGFPGDTILIRRGIL
jgi:hypothetical protein